ncbi:MAG TPA: DinB family protein [Candidatus Dormibacteraeota bacterium]|nr:DinB family protein [Candidatus Dormibacteraeota bacterium]
MDELAALHRFNAWANRSLLAGLRRLRPDQLDEQQDGMYSTIRRVLHHLAMVEEVYLAMMSGGQFDSPPAVRSLDELERALERTGRGLVELAGDDLTRAFHVPWFDRDLTRADGLGQVLTHSINHRADINQWLPRFGVDSTEQDYVNFVMAGAE